MKLVERSNGLYLEDILPENIRFSNLAGRLTGSVYDDPERPKHVIVLWIKEEEDVIAEVLVKAGVNVKKLSEYEIIMNSKSESDYIKNLKEQLMADKKMAAEYQNHFRYSVQFKAYPKVRQNYRTGENEQYPKVMLKTTKSTVRLGADAFGLVDSAHISEMSLRFHLWQYNDRKPDCVAVLDEIWVLADEGAGEVDESYLDEKYGYDPGEPVVTEEDEVPFV